MGRILFAGGGGSGEHSSDLTAKKAWVLTGKTYVGNDTDDEAGTGTMPNIGATDTAKSVAQSGSYLVMRMSNGAHITNASSGYPEVRSALADVRKAINYTNAAKVLNDTTIAGLTGTMKNLSSSPSTRYTKSNNTPVLLGDAAYWTTNADGKARLQIRYNGTAGYITANTLFGVEKGTMTAAVKSAYGIGSVTGFSLSQYNSKVVLCSWTKPGSGKMWSGIVIRAKQGGYPTSVSDGTAISNGTNGTYVTASLATGTWYFRAWNYVTVNNGDGDSGGNRWYGSYVQGTFNNQEVKGDRTFTSSQNFTVPAGVRKITAFLVGGGGGSPGMSCNSDSSQVAGGGGGGRTTTTSFDVTPGQVLNINVGGGGGWGGGGGESSIWRSGSKLASAAGGDASAEGRGGNGGSGGGAARGSKRKSVNGGTNGGNGEGGNGCGYGQGSSTKCWDGALYSGGGGGGATSTLWTGIGGKEGGGSGGGRGSDWPSSGKDNTGGGAGGGAHNNNEGSCRGANGGSGIVRIKWGY